MNFLQIDYKKMGAKKGTWVGFIAIVVLLALGLWWIAARQSIDTNFGFIGLWGSRGQEELPPLQGTPVATPGAEKPAVTSVNRPYADVSAVISSLSSASQFNAMYRSTGVAATISKNGSYTIFVPTNGAFGQLAPGTIASMTATEKKRLVQYHIISGRTIDADALRSGSETALSGDVLNFNYGTDEIPMVNSAIVITEYKTKNGVVYLIDNVLLPPKRTP